MLSAISERVVLEGFQPQYRKKEDGSLVLSEKKQSELNHILKKVKNKISVPSPSEEEMLAVVSCRDAMVSRIKGHSRAQLFHYDPCPIFFGKHQIII